MKVKHLFLALALVGFMASCDKKAPAVETPTATETEVQNVETPTATETEEPKAEEPKKTTEHKAPAHKPEANKPAPVKANPCKAALADVESFAAKITAAKANRSSGAAALKEYQSLVKQAETQRAKAKDCMNDSEYSAQAKQVYIKIQNAVAR